MVDLIDMTYTLEVCRKLSPYFIIDIQYSIQYMKLFIFILISTDGMAQRLVSLSPNPMIVTSSPTRSLYFIFNVSKLLSSLSKYVEADFMNLRLEENSLDNIPEELSTLMHVRQTLTTGTFTCIPGTYTQQRIQNRLHAFGIWHKINSKV